MHLHEELIFQLTQKKKQVKIPIEKIKVGVTKINLSG